MCVFKDILCAETLNGLHEEYQSAYKMLYSTETTLFRVQHDISCELDKNHAMLFVMLDLSSAFDTIDHDHLLTLLHDEYGVRETAFIMVLDVFGRPHPLCPDILKNTRDYSATEWCTRGLGPWACHVHSLHHPYAADIQKT